MKDRIEHDRGVISHRHFTSETGNDLRADPVILRGLELSDLDLCLQRRLAKLDIGNCSRPHSGRSWNWAGVGVAEKV
jgi:hypothetical protein